MEAFFKRTQIYLKLSQGSAVRSARMGVLCDGRGATELPSTSDGRSLKWERNRLLKCDELLNPMEYAISVIDSGGCCGDESRS